MAVKEFDVIVIGAGAVGENVADRAAQGGLSVAIVEEELVGGECSYWACMPTKALLRPGTALRAARRVPGAREAFGGPLDAAQALRFRDGAAADWSDRGQVAWLDSAGIALIRGRGRIAGVRSVEVDTPDGEHVALAARSAVVICTGSAPVVPNIPGLADAVPWTNREAAAAAGVPSRLVIIGAGVVAAEFATAFASLGSAVTMLVRGSRLLSGAEPFAGELVAAGLTAAGVAIRSGTEAVRVRRDDRGVRLELGDGETVVADEVLVATGRRPRTEGLGLESVGLEPGAVTTDDTLLVLDASGRPVGERADADGGSAREGWLYAVGDVTGRALLTHQGKYQARAAGDVIAARATGAEIDDAPWGRHVATADHGAVPQVVFTDPEVAAVGLTEEQAREAGHEVRAVEYDLGQLAGASVQAEGYTGRAKLVVDARRGVVLGATFVGADVAEMLAAATIAVVGEVPIHRLWHAVPAYPTLSEVWLRLLEALGRDTADVG